jgi:hypothetical protein
MKLRFAARKRQLALSWLAAVCLLAATGPARAAAPGDTSTLYLPLVAHQAAGLAVDVQDRAAVRSFYLDQYAALSGLNSQMAWTGDWDSCQPGSISAAYRAGMAQRINWFRAMAGVPANISFAGDFNQKAQAAALMMSVNRNLSHDPPANWQCYSADGHTGAGNSNLYIAYGLDLDPIWGYMQDGGSNNSAAGHRRWILYPQTQQMGTGDVPQKPDASAWRANALWVFDSHTWDPRPATREAFVAWPPAGFVPYEVVFGRWSFAYAGADFSHASVAMTVDGSAAPAQLEPLHNGYGENTLVWLADGLDADSSWPQPGADQVVQVTVNNVVLSGGPQNFSYTVTIFAP